MQTLTDQNLMAQWSRDRNADAFAEIVSRHGGMVFATCRRILGSLQDAEDVTQECFLHLVRAPHCDIRSLGAWLHQLAVRRSLDRMRQVSRRLARESRYADVCTDQQKAAGNSWGLVEPVIDEAIAGLPDLSRRLVIGHFLEGRSYSELAEETGLARATLARRVQEVVEEVRQELAARGVSLTQMAALGCLETNLQNGLPLPTPLAAKLGKLAIAAGPPVQVAIAGGAILAVKKLIIVAVACAAGLVFLARIENWGPWKSGAAPDVAAHLPERTGAGEPRPTAGPPASPSKNVGQKLEARKNAPAAAVETGQGDTSLGTWFQSLLKKPSLPSESAKSTDVPEDNAAHFFLLAAELFPDTVDQRIRELLEMARSGSPIDIAELNDLVEKCRDSLAAIQTGLEVRDCQWPEVSGGEPMPYLSKFRTLSQLMDLQALSAIQQGDPGAACKAWSELLQFSDGTARGCGLAGRFSGNFMFEAASNDIRAAVMAGAIPSEQLTAFLHTANDIETRRVPFSESVAVDNSSALAWYESLLQDPANLRAIMMLPECTPDRGEAMAMAAVPPEQLQVQLSEAVQWYRTCTEYVSMPYYEFKQTYQEPSVDQNPFAEWFLRQIQPAPAAEAKSDAGRAGTLLVGALQLYHDLHGQWPEDIDALAPAFLRQVPHDPFTGEPFIYRAHPDGFLLYSAGANMLDDGGTLDKYDAPNGDLLIWPATQQP